MQKVGITVYSQKALIISFSLSLSADNLASTMRLFWLQSRLLYVADNPDIYSLILQIL